MVLSHFREDLYASEGRLQLATEPSFKATNAKLAFPCGMGVQPKGVMNHVPFVCLVGAKARFFLAI